MPPVAILLAGLLAAGPLVGRVTHEDAIVWVSPADPGARCEVEWRPADGEGPARRAPLAREGDGRSHRATIAGLEPATTYEYVVRVGGGADPEARGSFTTAPPPGAPFRATFAVASCMRARGDRVQRAWEHVAADGAALLLLVGDTHYANTTRRDVLWRWNLEQRAVPSFARLVRTTPVLAVWDDHDYGANNGDGTLRGKEESLAAWGELWANGAGGLLGAPGVFFRAQWGDVDLFLLDERYHRSPNAAPDDDRKAMLGEAQFRWLEDGLRTSRATFKIVAGGSTIWASTSDGWRHYSRDRTRLLRALGGTDGAIRISGDIHRSLVSRFPPAVTGGHAVYEVISSGVALGSEFLPDSYALLSIDTTARDPSIEATIVTLGAGGEVVRRATTPIRASELRPH